MKYEFQGFSLEHAVSQAVFKQSLDAKAFDKANIKYDFVKRAQLGQMLLVGEGNLSFTVSLLKLQPSISCNLTATVYEHHDNVAEFTARNASELDRSGVQIGFGVDATKLGSTFAMGKFSTIVFQFPNVASRTPKYGQNPNHILVTRFIKSAREILEPNGHIIVTTVDSPHYEGVFRIEDAATKAGCQASASDFDPRDYPGYQHVNTDEDASAISEQKSS